MAGKVQTILTSDVLRAHSYLGARGWELDDAPPAERPGGLAFRAVSGYRHRDDRRALLAVDDAGGTLVLYEYPDTKKGTGAEPAGFAPARVLEALQP